tara:strand:+ start:229 stop:564 length:336 start_codon:yes stop_codon:yes gene_type:complete
MFENRKHLVRCNSAILKRVVENKVEYWKSDGFIDFEVNLDITFVMSADESILNEVFTELVKQHDTDDFRYEYIDFELIFNFPTKLKGNPVKTYNNKFKEFTNNIKKELYEQ